MGLLDGKKVLITGARKGIGRGIAITLANEGAIVGINDILEDQYTKKLLSIISKKEPNGSFHKGDVSTINGINAVFDSFMDTHGQIDILVNNAIFPDQQRPFFETDELYWDRMMNLSLKGYFFASQRAAKEMIASSKGGRIISFDDKNILFSIGDYQSRHLAQNMKSINGKIIKINIENSNYLSLLSSKFMFPITLFLLVEIIDYKTKNLHSISSTKYVLLINCYLILILLFSARNYAPFIYFQF